MSDPFNECGSFRVGDLKLTLRQSKELLEDAVKQRDKCIAELEAENKRIDEALMNEAISAGVDQHLLDRCYVELNHATMYASSPSMRRLIKDLEDRLEINKEGGGE